MPQFWNDITKIPEAQWIVYGTLLIFAVLIAVYVSIFFRNMATGGKESEELDLLSEFRNLRDQGHLDDHEYDRLKAVVPENTKHELLRGVAGVSGSSSSEDVKEKFMTLAEAESLKKASPKPESTDDEREAESE